MSQRRLLITLATLAAAFFLALAVSLGPSAHAASAPPSTRPSSSHVVPPSGAHPYSGSASTSPRCNAANAWYVVPNPQPSVMYSQFNGVAASSANDVWAVGNSEDQSTAVTSTLIEHYYSVWSTVSSPNIAGTDYDSLSSVVAVTTDDAWAVGDAYTSSAEQTLIEHYDGISWSIVSSPSPASFNTLNSVAADGQNDVWAVGDTEDPTSRTQAPLVEHWDGNAWSTVTVPAVGTTSSFTAVSVVAGQVFAVGSSTDVGGVSHTLVEHYVPGSGWSVMTTLDAGTNGSQLMTSTALTPSNVWVAGFSQNADSSLDALIEHWNGTAWTITPGDNPSPTHPSPTSIYGLSAIPATTHVWAVGQDTTDPSTATAVTFAEQWQGSAWQDATSATPAGTDAQLNGVAAVSTTDAWAVGVSYDTAAGTNQTLIEHYAGPVTLIWCR